MKAVRCYYRRSNGFGIEDALDSRSHLLPNTVIAGSYCIERVLGAGGFAVTYAAEDTGLRVKVAIKEYYPEEFGVRDASMSVRPKSERHKSAFQWGRSSFLQEARTLARFEHPSIVRVTRVFEANSTAYMVMEFERGETFEAWLTHLGRPPTQEELDRISAPLLDALELLHAANFLHRDIAPDNIVVRANGTPVLLDFGAARTAIAERSRMLTGIVKAGYSPFEQYATDSRLQGPWTDLYAVGATLFRAVSGHRPEEATLRISDDRMVSTEASATGSYRPSFLAAIDMCLRAKIGERPQSVAQLRSVLFAESKPRVGRVQAPRVYRANPPAILHRLNAQQWAIVAAVLVAVMAGLYGGFAYSRWLEGERTRRDVEARARLQEEIRLSAERERQRILDAERQNHVKLRLLLGFHASWGRECANAAEPIVRIESEPSYGKVELIKERRTITTYTHGTDCRGTVQNAIAVYYSFEGDRRNAPPSDDLTVEVYHQTTRHTDVWRYQLDIVNQRSSAMRRN